MPQRCVPAERKEQHETGKRNENEEEPNTVVLPVCIESVRTGRAVPSAAIEWNYPSS